MKTVFSTLVLLALLASAEAPVAAQSNEKVLVGQVQYVDESGTVITLTDGTRLLMSPGALVQPIEIGMVVVAVYRVHDNGDKVVMRLSRGPMGPALDNPKKAPAPESPPGPPGVTNPTGHPTNKADFEAPCVGLPIRPPIILGSVCA